MLRLGGLLCVLQASAMIAAQSCDPASTFSCDDGTCIPKSRECNSNHDCPNGEDEKDCSRVIACPARNPNQARYNDYRCSRSCQNSRSCANDERCVCDDECGRSCIKIRARCTRPPVVLNAVSHKVIRFSNGRKNVLKPRAYRVRDLVRYQCSEGLSLTGPMPRCSSTGRWTTGKPQCVDFSKCGQAGQVRLKRAKLDRIIGGKDSTETAWPWYALISQRKSTSRLTFSACAILGGGSLIKKKWVLTAAHVFSAYTLGHGVAPNWQRQIIVSLGVIQRPLTEEIPSTIKSYISEDIVIHANFRYDTYENDIALIKLGNQVDLATMTVIPESAGIEFSYYIRRVCLPCSTSCFDRNSKRTASGQPAFRPDMTEQRKCKVEEKFLLRTQRKVVVTGFGHTKPVQSFTRGCVTAPHRLQQGELSILPTSTCQRAINNINRNHSSRTTMVFNNNFLCCVGKDANATVDACQGDSGGPVVRKVGAADNACWVQLAIVSWGIGCGTKLPAYYTNVGNYAMWIRNAISAHARCRTGPRTPTGACGTMKTVAPTSRPPGVTRGPRGNRRRKTRPNSRAG